MKEKFERWLREIQSFFNNFSFKDIFKKKEQYLEQEDVKLSFRERIEIFFQDLKRIFFKKKKKEEYKIEEPFFLIRWLYLDKIFLFFKLLREGKGFPDSVYSNSFRNIHQQFFLYFVLIIIFWTLGMYLAWEYFPKNDLVYKGRINFFFNKIAIDQLKSNQLFKTKELTLSKGKSIEDMPCESGDLPSSLNLKFAGLSLLQDPEKSLVALFVDGSSDPTTYRMFDKIRDQAKIFKIDDEKIIFRNLKTGVCEYLTYVERTNLAPIKVLTKAQAAAFLESEKKFIVNQGNTFKIKKSFLNEKLKNIQAILNDAYSMKIDNSDGSQSYKISNITPGSIYSYLGIQDNDLITKIDGKKIRAMTDILGFFSKIKTIKNIGLTIERNGRVEELKYVVED